MHCGDPFAAGSRSYGGDIVISHTYLDLIFHLIESTTKHTSPEQRTNSLSNEDAMIDQLTSSLLDHVNNLHGSVILVTGMYLI